MDTVMVNLQAAVMAAAAGGADALSGGIPEDGGVSFSDVLAAQTGGADGVTAEINAAAAEPDADDGLALPAESNAPKGSVFEELAKQLDNADDGIKKGLKLLVKTVLKALRGSGDGKERKTDLFAVFSDSGAGLFGEENDELFLFGAEFMNRVAVSAENELDLGTDASEMVSALDRLLSKIFDDDEPDENTAADALAAMLGISSPLDENSLSLVSEDEMSAAVSAAAEVLSAPKEAVRTENPEEVPKMEQLYEDFKTEIELKLSEEQSVQDTVHNARNVMGANPSSLKINDAAQQVRSIAGETSDEDIDETAAAAAVQTRAVPAESPAEISDVHTADEIIARSVENQIAEKISEKLFDMKSDSGTEELIMVLKPENLGHVAVKLVKENGAVSVLLSAQYDEVGKLMAERAVSLGDSLAGKNISVKSVEVVNPSSAAEQMGLDFSDQGFGFGRGSEYSSDKNSGNSYRGLDAIDEIEETDPQENNIIREARLWATA